MEAAMFWFIDQSITAHALLWFAVLVGWFLLYIGTKDVAERIKLRALANQGDLDVLAPLAFLLGVIACVLVVVSRSSYPGYEAAFLGAVAALMVGPVCAIGAGLQSFLAAQRKRRSWRSETTLKS